RLGLAIQRIRGRRSFAQAIGPDPLGGYELGDVSDLLALRAEASDGKDADARLSAQGRRPGAVARHLLGNDDGGDLVELEPSVLLGNVGAAEANLCRFLQKLAQQAR